jgi:nucleotidyltransferase substrate binding protein (TIGR01987 family)
MIEAFKKFPQIKEVSIFGSRSRGDYKKNSDIDLAISFKEQGEKVIYQVIEELSNIDTILSFDVLDKEKIKNVRLWEYLEEEGEVIYKTNKNGEAIVDRVQLSQQLVSFSNAIDALLEAVEMEAEDNTIILDGIIKRFEYSYELAWRLMRAYLEYKGEADISDAKSSIRQAYKNEIVENGEEWLSMLLDRNKVIFMGSKEQKLKVYVNIKETYIALLNSLYIQMEKLLNVKK